jgi:hypothetical protein
MIGIVEQQESVIRQCAFLMGERDRRVYHVIQRSSMRLQGYTNAIEESKVYRLSRDQRNEINTPS